MENETKFEQHLKFRRGENGFDYPGHEVKASSSSARSRRKHKLVSSLISVDKGGAMNKCGVQKNDRREFTERSTRDTLTSNGLKKESSQKKSTETRGDESAAVIDDVKFFMESLLEDLNAGRQNLFVWMKDEMRKLMARDADVQFGQKETGNERSFQFQADDQDNFGENMEHHDQSDFDENIQLHHQKNSFKENFAMHSFKENFHMQHHNKVQNAKVQNQTDFEENVNVQSQNSFKSGIRTQSSSDGSLMRSIESKEESGFDNYYQTLEDLDVCAQSTREESLALQVEPNTQHFPADQGRTLVNIIEGKRTPNLNFHEVLECQSAYDQEVESTTSSMKEKGEAQVASSMDFTVPTALTGQPCLNNRGLDISCCKFIQPTVAGNRYGINVGGENHHGYVSGVQMEEPKRSAARLCSGNVDSLVFNLWR